MTLLQPTDVPSMDGINNAITSEIAEHASTTEIGGPHYDSGWLPLDGVGHENVNWTVRQYRVKNGMVQVRFSGTMNQAFAVSNDGNITDRGVGVLPPGARPGGGGINASAPFPVEIGGHIIHGLVYNGGSVNLAYADRTGAAYNVGAAGTSVVCISPFWSINS